MSPAGSPVRTLRTGFLLSLGISLAVEASVPTFGPLLKKKSPPRGKGIRAEVGSPHEYKQAIPCFTQTKTQDPGGTHTVQASAYEALMRIVTRLCSSKYAHQESKRFNLILAILLRLPGVKCNGLGFFVQLLYASGNPGSWGGSLSPVCNTIGTTATDKYTSGCTLPSFHSGYRHKTVTDWIGAPWDLATEAAIYDRLPLCCDAVLCVFSPGGGEDQKNLLSHPCPLHCHGVRDPSAKTQVSIPPEDSGSLMDHRFVTRRSVKVDRVIRHDPLSVDSTPRTTEYGLRTAPISLGDRRRRLASMAIRTYIDISASDT
ncbi:hypothetical protein FPQ18DRAFT_310655 [Pyronema domesticum]|nr:hypothetical protein FPQ18DRAFT_310655 [Pyronema domesticum]